ncbi:MAG: RagB/SusD family nutrient uptake outer membrane protein, partial [Muribaculaceae bacterium]|nr:RagB/SusD family nutrient uptake outer membrane protein [Muribaculaceae bacterium]
MKRNFIKIISCIAITAAATSCNDWLDGVPNKNSISEETVWDTPENASAYVSGFYTFIDKYGQFGGNQYSGALTEALTDAFKYGSSALVARGGHNNQYVMMPEVITVGSHYYSVWSTAYGNIRRINQFLRDMEKYSTFDEESEKIWEAQARFFRAYVYFQLAKRHPGVILYDELPTDGQRDRATEEETWDFIEQDLDFAASVLPKAWPSSDEGRITYGAVMGFKSRVMLYAKRWQKAYDAAAEVEKLEQEGIYGLVNDYTQAWKGKNKEALIQFFYAINNGPAHAFDKNYVPECDGYAYG